MPAGHHVLPEQERARILGAVRDGREKVHAALDSLPFVKDTLRLRQRDTQLVQQLADLEQVSSTSTSTSGRSSRSASRLG